MMMRMEDYDIELSRENSRNNGDDRDSDEYSILSSDGGESFYKYPNKEQPTINRDVREEKVSFMEPKKANE